MFKLPSRVQKLEFSFAKEKGVELFMKRDDEIHELVSGNKWRKLKPIFQKASERGIQRIQSMGGPYSNHLLALAVACKFYGFESEAFIRGEEVENPVLNICKAYGMKLNFISRDEFRARRNENKALVFSSTVLFIPEGAAVPEGEEGMKSLLDELEEEYSDIIDCVGSGTSVKGLARFVKPGTKLHAVMCVKDESLARELDDLDVNTLRGYERGGFAKIDREMMEACADFQEQTGILLDPIYTTKMWMCCKDLIEKGRFEKGSRILLVHSGGLQGWLGDGMMKALNEVRNQ